MLETILQLARIFQDHGKQVYMVGGTVRDLLLQREASPDADLTTDATPDEIKRLVAPLHPKDVVPVGERFGTVRFYFRQAGPAGRFAGAEQPAASASDMPAEDIIEIT